MYCLPYISLQPNYSEVVADIQSSKRSFEKVWISAYSLNSPDASIHTKLNLSNASSGSKLLPQLTVESNDLKVIQETDSLDLTVSTVREVEKIDRDYTCLRQTIAIPSTRLHVATAGVDRTLELTATSKVNDNYTNYPTIDAFDLSPTDNGLYVAGGVDGRVVVGQMPSSSSFISSSSSTPSSSVSQDALDGKLEEPQQQPLHLQGHLGDIRHVRFFPSGQVVLTSSTDLRVRIFSAIDASNPRTLTGNHKRVVTSTCLIDRGAELLTGGADGTIRLYSLSQSNQLSLYNSTSFSPVNTLSRFLHSPSSTFFAGLNNGSITQFDIRNKNGTVSTVSGFEFPITSQNPLASDFWSKQFSGSITALDHQIDSNHLVTGTRSGIVSFWDLRSFQNPILSYKRNGSEVTDLVSISTNQVAISTLDGLPYQVEMVNDDNEVHVVSEFVGWDCDVTSSIKKDHLDRIVIAGSEGRIRRY